MINDWDNIEIFTENQSTLTETSYDDGNSEYMTELKVPVIDFDNVKEQYLQSIGCQDESLTSVDALLLKANCNVFIEFKNGSLAKKEVRLGIYSKIQDSLLMLCDITDSHISQLRQCLDFILVYNEVKNPSKHNMAKDYINDHLTALGGKEFVRFGLERYAGVYFRNVHTYNVEEFEEYVLRFRFDKGR